MKRNIIIFFILVTHLTIFSQSEKLADSSAKELSINEYKLLMNFQSESPMLLIKPNFNLESDEIFFIPTFQSSVIDDIKYRNEIRNQMNSSLQIYKQGLNKNDLGVVGEILGYTNAAAAIGLAAYHVYKYRKEYGLK